TDGPGDRAIDSLEQRGLESACIQRLPEFTTGRAVATQIGGEVSYRLPTDMAYDYIGPPSLERFQDVGFSCLYHGSLACRGEVSRQTLFDLIDAIDAPRYVDVNIRQPHFDLAWLPKLLVGADWVKMSGEELEFLSGIQVDSDSSLVQAVEQLRSKFGHATYLTTFGDQGTAAVVGSGVTRLPAEPVTEFKDSIGAGDAFSAAFIAGTLAGLTFNDSLKSACKFAARVCSVAGGTPQDLAVYKGAIE
ncbi:MAG: PfkB family carbohydrate kinase, partial [Planctomycetota bacterium]